MPNLQVFPRRQSSSRTIHIFNGFQNPHGGSELEALSLYSLLHEKAEVWLWTTSSRASGELTDRFPIRRIAVRKGMIPKGGTFLFVGAHWRNKLWPYFVPTPDRLIYVYNTFHPKVIALTSSMPPLLGWPRAEYVFISEFQKTLLRLEGEVHASPIDIERFAPAPRVANGRPVIGRLSRDTPDKHHPEDIAFYQTLARQGCVLRLQGATCIADRLPADRNIRIYREGHFPAPQFLQELDIFYYRSGAHVETFGRVIFEAMACGLPVVCHSHGGYAEAIRHGDNGFLFDSTAQAHAWINQLVADPALRARIGASARKTAEDIYSEEARERRLAFYLE